MLSDDGLRAALLVLWIAVTDAGGSVGFSSPAPVDLVAATLDRELAEVRAGRRTLGVVRPVENDLIVAMGMLVGRDNPLFDHWRTVMRVMVHPDHQDRGAGRAVMAGLHRQAQALGCEHLQLSVRDGEGLDGFYADLGYREVGRHPGAVRMGPGDDRDEVMLVADLR